MDIVSTLAWAFDQEIDWRVSRARFETVRQHGGRVCIAELGAPLDLRIQRNHLADRTASKPNQAATLTDDVMRDLDARYRLSSQPGELAEFGPYLRLDTTEVSAFELSARIIEEFRLPRIG